MAALWTIHYYQPVVKGLEFPNVNQEFVLSATEYIKALS
jgi:hypothetical protein